MVGSQGRVADDGARAPYRSETAWLVAAILVTVVTLGIDLLTPRGIAAGVIPHFIAIALTAFCSMRWAPYVLAGLASVFTLIGFALTSGGVAEIVLVNRAFLIAVYWLGAVLVHLKQKSDAQVQQSRADLEGRIEERTRTIAANEAKLRLITDRLPALIAYVDRQQRYTFVNNYYDKIAGAAGGRTFGDHVRDLLGEEGYAVVEPNIERVLAGETVHCTVNIPTPEGPRNFRVTYVPDPSESGAVVGFVLLALDVTEETKLQERLDKAQRLEAVGQLSGGVAHDFNNLLGVIIGNLELAAPRAGAEARRFIDTALRAADRGAALTHRLLAFARRQPLRPQTVDLKVVVQSMEELLERTLGEEVTLHYVVAADLWPVTVDAGQLEAAILNLAINARDALPGGGRITIETSNATIEPGPAAEFAGVAPGDYAVLSVTDDGAGMTPEVLAHVFEPFFTTKPPGKGSGLGLPMVYGFARQSGGNATVYSEAGEGTTVRIYLPRAAQAPDELVRPPSPEESRPLGRAERVLLVEDNAPLSALVVTMLEQLNYRVTACDSGWKALEALDRQDFALLLTDLVLPDALNGRELADAARARSGPLAVVYMTGYVKESVAVNQRLEPGAELLEKPFRIDQLAQALARALAAMGKRP